MLELAAVIIALAFVVLVGVVIPTVLQLRKTVLQAERLLAQVSAELPEILKDLRQTNENVRVMSTQAREGVGRASVLVNALGQVGETVNQVHGMFRGKGLTFAKSVVEAVVGLKAVVLTLKNRAQKKEGG